MRKPTPETTYPSGKSGEKPSQNLRFRTAHTRDPNPQSLLDHLFMQPAPRVSLTTLPGFYYLPVGQGCRRRAKPQAKNVAKSVPSPVAYVHCDVRRRFASLYGDSLSWNYWWHSWHCTAGAESHIFTACHGQVGEAEHLPNRNISSIREGVQKVLIFVEDNQGDLGMETYAWWYV